MEPHLPLIKYFFVAVIVLAALLSLQLPNGDDEREYLTVHPFSVEGGWGYCILMSGDTVIYQPFIPTITGREPFKTSNEARTTGLLVISKLRKGKGPSLDRGDLDSLGINLPEKQR